MEIVLAILGVILIVVVVALQVVALVKASPAQTQNTIRTELAHFKNEQGQDARATREELQKSIYNLGEILRNSIKDSAEQQSKSYKELSDNLKETLSENVKTLDKLIASQKDESKNLRDDVAKSLESIQKNNDDKLEKIRLTVEEKLQSTLEKRLGESFKLVSERLESVQKGLGEMQNLATGVGDLKKVLTNVKTRGIWGEVLLGNLLEQVLTPEQYETNVATTGTSERVEFAIKLPGKGSEDKPVWIPLDSKFPKEDYERLLEAQESGDAQLAQEASKRLDTSIKKFADDISSKYIAPPKTTDFAIMFLPNEGLYAEVIRRTEITEHLQRKSRVLVTGPTTLTALLNSLQMGFKTLAIQQRSSEVWELLGGVKTEFEKYGAVMEKVKKKLQEASNSVESVDVRTRQINRKLSKVEQLEGAPQPAMFLENELDD